MSSCEAANADPALLKLLTSCPRAGSGVHRWVWLAVIALRRKGFDEDQISRLLIIATKSCGRDCLQDIEDAISNSSKASPRTARRSCTRRLVHRRLNPKVHRLPKVPVNEALRRKVVTDGLTLADLKDASPSQLPADQTQLAGFVLHHLFPADPLLCIAVAQDRHLTLRKKEVTRPYLYPLIVPSPMSARWGVNQKGEASQRCLNNTGPRRYLVCEFDLPLHVGTPQTSDDHFVDWARTVGKTTHDVAAALLVYLAQGAPLVMVVDSGHKSLHGWFNVQGWPEHRVWDFMCVACCLGADPHTYLKCQLVRMAGAVRRTADGDPEAFQDVLYFDEAKCAAPV